MHLLAKPNRESVADFLRAERTKDFTYPVTAGTQTSRPNGFREDCNRVLLGHGEATFEAACKLLRQWKMFPTKWTEIQPADASTEQGVTVAVLIRCFGKWWLNSSRIVYVLDEIEPTRRFGFAYGTLPGHVECGEEQFLIEWDSEDHVWYELSSFSRPRYWLVRLAAPLARHMQKKFIRDSLSQMREMVRELINMESASNPEISEAGIYRDARPSVYS